MTFLYSLKLFKSNFSKAIKLFLCYIVIFGLCFCMLLPVYFEFFDLISESFRDNNLIGALSGAFGGSIGLNLHTLFVSIFNLVVEFWEANVGLTVLMFLVLFVIMPFMLHVANYTFCEMLHSYMTSKSKFGFFSAFVRGLKKSILYALGKVFCSIVFYAIVFGSVYALTLVTGDSFIEFAFPAILFVMFVVLFSLREALSLGFMPALIVFNCSQISARKKGVKALTRHLVPTLMTTFSYFVVFALVVLVFGAFSLVVLVPIIAALMNCFNMVAFFSSQGMRFYFDNEHILTPKKLEEVDSIKKIYAIL